MKVESTLVLGIFAVAAGLVCLSIYNTTADRALREKALTACLENQKQAIANQVGKETWRWAVPDCRL